VLSVLDEATEVRRRLCTADFERQQSHTTILAFFAAAALQEGREKENTGCSTFSSYREMFSFGGMAQRIVTAGKKDVLNRN